MKLKFNPTSEWLATFQKLEKAVLLLPMTRPVNLQKIFNDVYLDKISMPVDTLESMLSKAPEEQAKKIIDLFMNLWNMTPRAAFDGKTPNQMAEDLASQAPEHAAGSEWTKIMELLLNIQGNFQAEFYDAITKLTPKEQEVAVAYSHRLFERYLYTVVEDFLPDQVAPADLIAGHLEHKGIAFPDNIQEQVRVFKTPVKNPAPDRRLRMVVGQETIEQFPVISDYFNSRKKSELYPNDLHYNRLLAAVTKCQPKTEFQTMAVAWEYAIEACRTASASIRKAYDPQEWRDLWIKQFDLASKDWVSTDEIFSILIERIHNEVLPMQAAVDQLNAPKDRFIEPLDMEELAAYMMLFDTQIAYARDLISPLVTYLPIIEARYIEPLDISEELEGPPATAQSFIDYVSKPPSYFTLRSPMGRQLWKNIKKELAYGQQS